MSSVKDVMFREMDLNDMSDRLWAFLNHAEEQGLRQEALVELLKEWGMDWDRFNHGLSRAIVEWDL